MTTGVISQRYARALMNLAEKGDQVEPVAAELDGLADTLTESAQLRAFFEESRVPRASKLAAVEEWLKKADASELVSAFVRFVTQKRRVLLLDEIRREFHRLADERLGRAQAAVTVAVPLSAEEEKALREKLEQISGKQITMTVSVEPEIIGGVITRIGSSVRDGSLRTQLELIRHQIREG